jgi:hypothetical protein
VGDMTVFSGLFRTAHKEGLGVTLHISEVGAEQQKKDFIIFIHFGDWMM